MKTRILTFALIIASMLAFAPVLSASTSPAGTSSVREIKKVTALIFPVTGTNITDATFTLTRFAQQGGQLVAIGTLTATVVDPVLGVLGTVTQTITLPVTGGRGSCRILHLELGPLDLDLLGLQVHLDKIVLDITAQSGPGNLLGNLLCAVANLLNPNMSATALTQVANLLNQIIGILG